MKIPIDRLPLPGPGDTDESDEGWHVYGPGGMYVVIPHDRAAADVLATLDPEDEPED